MPNSIVILKGPGDVIIDGLAAGSAIDCIANWPNHSVAIQALLDAYELWAENSDTESWSHDPVIVSVPPPTPPSLDELKVVKKSEFMAEGLKRIALQVSDWDRIETIKTVVGLWVSHLATNATPAQLKAKDIYLYVRDAVPQKIAPIATEANLAAIDPTAADPFADGTPWPT